MSKQNNKKFLILQENNFNHQLYETYKNYLTNRTNDVNQELINAKFKKDLTTLLFIASNKQQELTWEECKYLRLLWSNYKEILTTSPRNITIEDVKNLASYCCESWLKDNEKVELTDILNFIQDQAITLKLGDFSHCNSLLETIEKWWKIPSDGKYIARLVENKFIKIALKKYNQYKDNNISSENIEGNIFIAACKKHDIDYLKKVVADFGLNLTTLQIPTTTGNYWVQQEDIKKSTMLSEGPNIISPAALLLYISDKNFKKAYANFVFYKSRIHPDSDKDRNDFAKMHYTTPLMMLCSTAEDFETTKENAALLIKYGADVNLVVKNHLDIPRTAASFAMGTTNYQLLEYLGEQGADLGKASNSFSEIIKGWYGGELPSSLIIIPTSLSPELKGEKLIPHWAKVCLIIERFFLKTITATKSFTTDQISTTVRLDGSDKEEQLTTEYINFKKQSQNTQKILHNTVKPELSERIAATSQQITNKFDLLFIKLIQKSAKMILEEKDFASIQQLIVQHPELECYAINSILEEFKKKNINQQNDTSFVQNILEYQPKWLHEFFLQKKAICNLALEERTPEDNRLKKFNSDVYQVENTNLHHKVFITLSKDLKLQLDNRSDFFYKKVQDTLSHCKFIATDSKNISGIKAYSNGKKQVIKLKIAHEDFSLSATQKYIEESTGNVLIILQEIQTHNNESNKPLITIICKNFIDYSEIKNLYDDATVHEQTDLSIGFVTPDSELGSINIEYNESRSSDLIGQHASEVT